MVDKGDRIKTALEIAMERAQKGFKTVFNG